MRRIWLYPVCGFPSSRFLTDPSTGCYPRWLPFQASGVYYCYIQVFKSATWQEARQECREREADLVSIGSQVEWEFVLGKLQRGQSIWLGLNDRQKEGHWIWSDGSE